MPKARPDKPFGTPASVNVLETALEETPWVAISATENASVIPTSISVKAIAVRIEGVMPRKVISPRAR
jgi:hypothetical protein